VTLEVETTAYSEKVVRLMIDAVLLTVAYGGIKVSGIRWRVVMVKNLVVERI